LNNISLELKYVGEINGEFIIPAYQRGYRWDKEVEILLNDINTLETGTNYCLQPVVVKKTGKDKYELIDGQQRLTTIFLIYKYIEQLKEADPLGFSINYAIRDGSKKFLDEINKVIRVDADNNIIADIVPLNIDIDFFIEAYKSIITWFKKQPKEKSTASKINTKFNDHVKVIWYETDEEDGESLFTRLNVGRIPLTNAELVKALFFSRDVIDDKKQIEIAAVWDIIEKELHDDSFWYFLTNEKNSAYPTRIELILNLMAEKDESDKDEFFTFLYFNEEMKKTNKSEIWENIENYFYRLKEWYQDNDLYHKTGYLIASGAKKLLELIDESKTKTKSGFKLNIDKYIAESIKLKPDKKWEKLNYHNDADKIFIYNLLLLFNAETIRQKNDETVRFPFVKHKKDKLWSLEHIHAQNSKGMETREQWLEWLVWHKKSLVNSGGNKELIDDISKAEKTSNLTKPEFLDLFDRIISGLSKEDDIDYIDKLSNLALLGQTENSTLSNWTFDVKRIKFLEMDKDGRYIPVCTRQVFLKYYTPLESAQLLSWDEEDRAGYIKEMNKVLENYLTEEIKI